MKIFTKPLGSILWTFLSPYDSPDSLNNGSKHESGSMNLKSGRINFNGKFMRLCMLIAFSFLSVQAMGQGMIPLPSHASTYTGYTRGFYFTVPFDMMISGVRVPNDANSTANQAVEILSFPTDPPTSGQGTQLYYNASAPTNQILQTQILVKAGDVIGVLGNKFVLTGYFDAINSYGSVHNTAIDGHPVTLYRFGFQDNLANLASNGLNLITGTTGSIGRVEVYWQHPQFGMNNAGVISIDSPQAFCAGTQSVVATIGNFGANQIDTLTINWSVNGTSQSPVNYYNLLDTFGGTGSTSAQVNLGNVPFPTSAPKTIKVWTSDPNNIADTVNDNDTMEVVARPSLSGNFTIGGTNPDYTTFTAAVDDLNAYGVCGPVTFHVRAGTYNEQVELEEIPGASATNTISFVGPQTGTAEITHDGSSSGDMATITLDGSDYITFDSLTISGTDNSYAVGVMFMNGADHNTISNCDIDLSTSATSAYTIGLLATSSPTSYSSYGDNANYNRFLNNNITGGYYGIRFNGQSTTDPRNVHNVFENNVIDQAYYYATYFYYSDSLVFNDNRVDNIRNSAGDAMYCYYAVDFMIDRNYFNANDYGVYLYYCNNYVTRTGHRSSFNNNIVISTTDYALRVYYTYNTDVFHNSVHSNSTTYSAYFYYADNSEVMNNIFSQLSTGYVFYSNNSNFVKLDHNIYYAPNSTGDTYYFNGTYYSSYADFLAATLPFNEHSYNEEPNYVNLVNGNLHLTSNVAGRRGANVGLPTDVDGDPRCIFAPSIGADESTFPEPLPNANFLDPDTVFVNSPTTIYNAAPDGAAQSYKWFVDGAFESDSRNLELQLSTTGTRDVKLVVEGCGGMDSITKTILVANPVVPPTPMFVADMNTVEIYEEVQLTDLSSGGATSWKYTVDPDSVFDPGLPGMVQSYNFTNGNAFSQNPRIVFNYPGAYTICLTATNAIGSRMVCRNDYIVVKASANMCLAPFSTNVPSGSLYDDGGPSINYGDGHNGFNLCTYLIDPCASKVTLNLNQFDLLGGDYLRVYDGADNNGTPLWNVNASPNGMTGGLNDNSVVNPLVASSGHMFIEFESDAKGNATGFEAEWTSVPGTFPPPVADFDKPDTACLNIPVVFENTSQGTGNNFNWDLDANGSIESSSTDFNYTFTTPGSYDIKLIVDNCGGSDTVTKSIIVVVPNALPRPDFMASITNPSVNETVFMDDITEFCADPNLYEWTIAPSTFIYVNGTDANSINPQVKFLAPGFYDVQLKVANAYGTDSVKKQNYIQVIQYCSPVVNDVNPDAGISHVALGDINKYTSAGQEKFTNFSESEQTDLERHNEYIITVERLSSNNPVSRGVWIDFNQDGDFDDMNETIVSTSSTGDIWRDTVSVPANAPLGATRLRVGIAFGTSLDPCGPAAFGEFEDYRVIITRDRTPPEITLTGADTISIERCMTYTDPGATAEDNIDGIITGQIVTVNNVNTNIPGIYDVIYNVQDAAGNMAEEVVRAVIVIEDTTKPVIAMIGNNPDTADVNVSYTDPGFTATDNCSGVMNQATAGSVNTAVPGTYILTYTVEDSAGNAAMENRTVLVVDRDAPMLTLNGNASDTIELCDTYNDAGASATDNYDTSVIVSVSGNLDTEIPGTYTLSYCATDATGNGPACINRDVIVLDRTDPVITLNGTDTINLEVLANFNDPGIMVDDLCNDDWNMTSGGTWTGTADQIGCFSIIYTVTDASGNSTNKERTICVKDDTKPVISLNGDPVVYLKRFEPWTDPYVTVSDNFDQNPTVNNGGNFENTLMPGTYYLTYQAEDQSGNKSKLIDRLVIVDTAATGINGNSLDNGRISIYPNPNNGSFNLEVELPQLKKVRISVLNSVGQEIKLVNDSYISSAKYGLNLQSEGSGLYFIRLQTNSGILLKKVNVIQ